MEIDLSPQLANKVYESNGGSYFTWSPSELPMLRHGNIGAAKLSLQNNGFSLPHYSDSPKLAYVLQGIGRVGIVLVESEEEKVVEIKKGDALALPFGTVTWWYNKEETELIVFFLGDTSKSHKPGELTDFFLTGSNGIFSGFSTEFVARAWDLEENDVKTLVGNQTGKRIVKLEGNITLPNPKPEHRNDMVLNCEEAPLDVDVSDGQVVILNTKNLPLLGEVGLGADLSWLDLEGRKTFSPGFSCDSALKVAYILSGSGRVEIVDVDGKKVLKTNVKPGHLLIVPRFFVVSKMADDELEWLSIYTTPNPICTRLAGSSPVWKALSPTVLQATFNASPGVEQLFQDSGVEQFFHDSD